MFGFVIAGASFLGLIWLGRSHRRHGWGRNWAFRRLDTSPGQEKVIRTAMAEARTLLTELRDENKGAKQELAQLLEAEQFDEQAVNAWWSGRQGALDAVKPRVIALGKQIHDVLDPEQRSKLARWVASGAAHFGHRHHGHHC
jgi:Spy/CpxP family protein refolding chaperone